jgi:uncharacterized protein
MPVVSNTSPILNLAIIDELELMHEQFGEVHVPREVVSELKLDTDLGGVGAVNDAISAGWLVVAELKDDAMVKVLRRELDAGESAALALALEMKAEMIILDEKEAREHARSIGLETTGVLGIMMKAHAMGRIDSLADFIERLRQSAGFFIHQDLQAKLLAIASK